MIRSAHALLLVLALAACSEPEAIVWLNQEGDACRTARAICLDAEWVRDCVDGEWVDRSCAQSCAARGPAMESAGCSEASLDVPIEGCQCVPLPGYCAPGETACESETELNYCNEDQEWSTHDCMALCAESLATPLSTGCSLDEEGLAACWCSAAG